jgi:hypothetical protein
MMIRVAWTRQGELPDMARPPSFGLETLFAELDKPDRLFANRRDAEAFIGRELRKCRSSGRNSQQGHWWGTDYEGRRGVRVQFEIYDEPGSVAMLYAVEDPFAPI